MPIKVFAIALLLCIATVQAANRFLILPGPSSITSQQSLYRIGAALALRGHDVLYATSQLDADLVRSLEASSHSAGLLVHLYKPYSGSSNLTLPVRTSPIKPRTKKQAEQEAAKESNVSTANMDDVQAWVHAARLWYAANCEAVLGADTQLEAAIAQFNPTHVIGDAAFVCFSHVADKLGNLPRLAVAVGLMPPLEQTLYGMTESVFEIPTYRSGLPRNMKTSDFLPQLRAHWQLIGPMKRTFRQLNELARNKYNITLGLKDRDPKSELSSRLRTTQALIIGLDPLLAAVPVQLPPHVHVVGSFLQPLPSASDHGRSISDDQQAMPTLTKPTLLLHVQTWKAGYLALGAVLDALSPILGHPDTATAQIRLVGNLPPDALFHKLSTKHQAQLSAIAKAGSIELYDVMRMDQEQKKHVVGLLCDANPMISQQAAIAGIPMVLLPVQGDQLDQAARLQELGTAVVIHRPNSRLQKIAATTKKTSNPQIDPPTIGSAINQVTGITDIQSYGITAIGLVRSSADYKAAAQAVSEGLAARTRHPIEAAADILEHVTGRHLAAAKLSSVTGNTVEQVLQKPGHSDGQNMLLTAAFAMGFAFMLLASLLSYYAKKYAPKDTADGAVDASDRSSESQRVASQPPAQHIRQDLKKRR